MVRTKMEIKRIEDKAKRHTTFTKRRQGLFKKTSELCKRCDASAAVIAFSRAGNAFAFGHPSVDAVLSRYEVAGGEESAAAAAAAEAEESDLKVEEMSLEKVSEFESVFEEMKRRVNHRLRVISQTLSLSID